MRQRHGRLWETQDIAFRPRWEVLLRSSEVTKLDACATVFFGDGQGSAGQPPISPFLEQMWRRFGRANPGSAEPEERERFVFWYILDFYERQGQQWPLPPELLTWLNAAAVDVTQEVREAPGLRGTRQDTGPKYLSRYMRHIWRTSTQPFNVKEMDGFFGFLAWYAFRFMPEHHIPPVLLPGALLEQLNRPADDERLPLSTGMLIFARIERPAQFDQLLDAPKARRYAICYELMRDVLAFGNPRLVPPFVSKFWRSAAGDGETAFDYVTSLAEAGRPSSLRLPIEAPLAHLFSSFAPAPEAVQELAPVRPSMLSIVSYRDHTTVCGLAKSGAYAIESLRAAGIEIVDLDYNIPRTNLKQESVWNARISNNSVRSVHVFNLNPEHVLECAMCNLSRIRENDYLIGQFFWELSDTCAVHEPGLRLMDEIWVSSDFLVNVYQRRVSVPVLNTGTAVAPSPLQRPYTRGEFGLREGDYLFLVNFDTRSVVERKNPLAAVEAFAEAFPKGNEKVGLAIKTRNVANISWAADREHWARTARRIEKDPRITVIDATLSEDVMSGLYSITDCYVSLHRSEGFGNAPAEALYWGKPVIVTAFSGVLDFCTDSTAKLVDYQLVAVNPGEYPFVDSEGSHFWAQPNLETASRHMRTLYENPQSGVDLANQGQRLVRGRYSLKALSQRYVTRLTELGFTSSS